MTTGRFNSSYRLLLMFRFFVSRLRGFVCLTRVIEGGRRVLLACCMIALSMVLRGHPMSLGGVFMMLSCLVMRVFCHVDVLWNRYFDSLNPMQVMNHSSSHPLRPGLITPALPANFPARAWPYMVMWLSMVGDLYQSNAQFRTMAFKLGRHMSDRSNFCLPAAGRQKLLRSD